MRKLINQGASINAQEVGIYGKKPIHIAAENNNKDIIEFLLSKGVSVDEVDKNGWTPLHWAASKGCSEVAEFLIEKGADINAENTYGKKPIQRAAERNNKNIIELLLSKGVSVNNTDKDGRTPLYWASWSGYLGVVEYLIGKGADISVKDKNGKTPLNAATGQKHDDVIKYLKQAQLNEKLLTAVKDSNFNEVQGLVNRGANVNAKDKDGKTPLHYASRSVHHLGMVKYLISKGADIDVKDNSGRTPEDEERYTNSDTMRHVFMQAHLDKELLVNVKNEKDLKTISDLIEKDIDDRMHGGFYYTWSGNLDTVKFLVSADVSVNATDKCGCKLLHWSAFKGHSDIAKFLVNKGANASAQDILGRTPMHFAVMNNHVNITDFLLKQGVSVDETDKNYAAEFSELDSARFLIEKKANNNTADNSGKKPIHVASENNNKNIIELFLSKGVSVDNADKDG